MVFVLSQLVTSAYELLVRGSPNDLGPPIAESVFLSIYAVFAVRLRRAGQTASTV